MNRDFPFHSRKRRKIRARESRFPRTSKIGHSRPLLNTYIRVSLLYVPTMRYIINVESRMLQFLATNGLRKDNSPRLQFPHIFLFTCARLFVPGIYYLENFSNYRNQIPFRAITSVFYFFAAEIERGFLGFLCSFRFRFNILDL